MQDNNKKMMDSIRHFKTAFGTLGELFDKTQLERVSKVSFEDKLFETWNHGRVVVIGDGMCFQFAISCLNPISAYVNGQDLSHARSSLPP